MQIQTFSILAGSEACNARCPFCVSKMTPSLGIKTKEPEVNWRNFRKACHLAKMCGVTTAMFTGKGEPTLFPEQITKYLRAMAEFEFPLIEVQTNGIAIAENNGGCYEKHFKDWYRLGMTLIAISTVHYESEKNREIYLPHKNSYFDLPKLVEKLHAVGFSVRLNCILLKGYIDSAAKLDNFLAFARENKVEQLSIIPVNKPEETKSQDAWQWANNRQLTNAQITEIQSFAETRGAHLMTLSHGAKVYDVEGQNLCVGRCLSTNPGENLRNLIFYPDGHLRYYWQYPGAILL